MILNLETIEKSVSSFYFNKFKSVVSVTSLRRIRNEEDIFIIEGILDNLFEIISKMTSIRSELLIEWSALPTSYLPDIDFSIGGILLFWVDFEEGTISFQGKRGVKTTFQKISKEGLLFQISECTKNYT